MVKLPKARLYRERQALTQEELAKLAGVSRVTITRVECGEQTYPSTARKIAQALNIQPSDLMAPLDVQLMEQDR